MTRFPVRYRLASGEPVISVTQILTIADRIDDTWFTKESAERGQRVHDLTEQIDRHESLDVPSNLEGYVEAYLEFLAVVRPTYHASELKVVNAVLGLAGRIDRVATIFGAPCLLDFKTSEPYPWHGQQLAFYNLLHPTGARFGCYLQKNGRYKLRAYDDPADHRRNMADLAAVRGTVTADGDFWTAM